ncbi:MAG: hypothetical protein DMF06_08055 [Verrucomicrobia bacterium]|nr:MAG: hypothetical protein DMF06_08055 [Verrucomicrobiota bacterium]
MNVIGPPKNDPGDGVGDGVGVGVGEGVGDTLGVGVGEGAAAVTVMLQEESAAPASADAASSREYRCQVPFGFNPPKATLNVTVPFAPAHVLPAALSVSPSPKSAPVSAAL